MQHLELRKENPKGPAVFLKNRQMFFQHPSTVWFYFHARCSLAQNVSRRLI